MFPCYLAGTREIFRSRSRSAPDVLTLFGGLTQLRVVDEIYCSRGPLTAISMVHQARLTSAPIAPHHTVPLTGDHSDLSDGGFSKRIQRFGAAPDDAIVFRVGAGKHPGTSTSVTIGTLKQSQVRTKRVL